MPNNFNIRAAKVSDVESIERLAEQRRVQYEKYQPTFWRPAKDASEKHIPFLRGKIEKGEAIALVCERDNRIIGFIAADVFGAPPVYDPGGKTCLIDDFFVDNPRDWETAGRALVEQAQHRAKELGAAQIVIVCGQRDGPKRQMLRSMGLTVASEWYTKPIK